MPAARPVRGLRIGVLRDYFEDLLEDDVRRALLGDAGTTARVRAHR